MVKGRRRKALVTNTCTTGLRNCYQTRRGITSYFHVAKIIDSDDDFKDDCKSYDGDLAKDALVVVVEESILNTSSNVSRASTPHRIQLNSDEDKKFVKGNLIRNNLNGKFNGKLAEESADNHKLTEYFPIRRSERKTKRTVLEEKRKNLEQLLRDGIEEGLKVTYFEGKGRGVVAVKPFSRGDFVVEYSGELLDVAAAKIREAKYAEDETTGCYMYYFKYLNQQYCIDATAETGRLGRLVNHSRNGNLITRTVSVDGYPHLVLLAKDDIAVGEEINYDYGDRSRESLKNHPWLAF